MTKRIIVLYVESGITKDGSNSYKKLAFDSSLRNVINYCFSDVQCKTEQ